MFLFPKEKTGIKLRNTFWGVYCPFGANENMSIYLLYTILELVEQCMNDEIYIFFVRRKMRQLSMTIETSCAHGSVDR